MAVGIFCKDWNTNKVVSNRQMEAYGKAFLRKYENLVKRKIRPSYQTYFQFLKEKPILINASISTSHGAAVEFIPSEVRKFQCQTVTTRIEHAVFPNKNLSISRKEGNAKPKLLFRILGKLANFRDIEVTTSNERQFLELSEKGSLRTERIVVDDINYPNTIIIKGSNRRNAWSRKAAKEEALSDFRGDFLFAYLESEEFREFVATPELTQIAKKIEAKQTAGKYGGEHGYLELKEDLDALNAAADAHGIRHEFSNNLYEFVKEQPSFRERHWIFCTLMLGFLLAFLIWLAGWGWKWIWVKLGG